MHISSGRSKNRSAVVMLAVASLALGGTLTAVAKTPSAEAVAGDVVAAASVEDEGADCPVNPPGSHPSNSRLPDPFTKLNGSRITTRSDWRCRRAEIRELAERHVYGDKPAKPTVTGTVTANTVTVNVAHNGRNATFSATVQLPSGTGPFPAVIVYGGFGGDTATIRAAGAATINFDPYTVGREGTPRNNKQGAFYTLYGNTSPTGLLMAWAWGVSRIIDVIEQSGGNTLRTDIGVTGCSRFGKGAFAAGVFDQRVALTMPIESGTAGLPVYRGVNAEGGQTLSSAYGEQPWFGDAFNTHTGNPNTTPIDTHSLVAMIAPRGLLVMDNPHITNLGPRSAATAALAGAEVYKALGATPNITYHSNVTDGTHCANRPEWRTHITQTIHKHLHKTGTHNGTITMHTKATANLTQWRDWTTPTLTDNNPTTTTTTSNTTTTSTSTTTTTTTTPQPGGCTATVSLNQWTGGFVATVKVTAGSTALRGWTVSMTLPSGATVTNAWNTDRSGNSGTVDFTNVSFNGTVPAGQSTEFGYQATGSGSGMTPTCAAR